jgi:26S proteasome non-ATPase regulatory subunit 9
MTRARIIHLKNDHKNVMSRLEIAIEEQFAQIRANQAAELEPVLPPAPLSIPNRSATGPISPIEIPFAKVDEVISNSPAEAAHLQVADQIIRFGTVNATNHERLRRLGEVVAQNEGVSCHWILIIIIY